MSWMKSDPQSESKESFIWRDLLLIYDKVNLSACGWMPLGAIHHIASTYEGTKALNSLSCLWTSRVHESVQSLGGSGALVVFDPKPEQKLLGRVANDCGVSNTHTICILHKTSFPCRVCTSGHLAFFGNAVWRWSLSQLHWRLNWMLV